MELLYNQRSVTESAKLHQSESIKPLPIPWSRPEGSTGSPQGVCFTFTKSTLTDNLVSVDFLRRSLKHRPNERAGTSNPTVSAGDGTSSSISGDSAMGGDASGGKGGKRKSGADSKQRAIDLDIFDEACTEIRHALDAHAVAIVDLSQFHLFYPTYQTSSSAGSTRTGTGSRASGAATIIPSGPWAAAGKRRSTAAAASGQGGSRTGTPSGSGTPMPEVRSSGTETTSTATLRDTGGGISAGAGPVSGSTAGTVETGSGSSGDASGSGTSSSGVGAGSGGETGGNAGPVSTMGPGDGQGTSPSALSSHHPFTGARSGANYARSSAGLSRSSTLSQSTLRGSYPIDPEQLSRTMGMTDGGVGRPGSSATTTTGSVRDEPADYQKSHDGRAARSMYSIKDGMAPARTPQVLFIPKAMPREFQLLGSKVGKKGVSASGAAEKAGRSDDGVSDNVFPLQFEYSDSPCMSDK